MQHPSGQNRTAGARKDLSKSTVSATAQITRMPERRGKPAPHRRLSGPRTREPRTGPLSRERPPAASAREPARKPCSPHTAPAAQSAAATVLSGLAVSLKITRNVLHVTRQFYSLVFIKDKGKRASTQRNLGQMFVARFIHNSQV